MKAIEGAIYCQDCAGKLSRRTPSCLALSYPAAHDGDKGTCRGCDKDDGDKGTCRGCDKEVQLRAASKVMKREMR